MKAITPTASLLLRESQRFPQKTKSLFAVSFKSTAILGVALIVRRQRIHYAGGTVQV
jgi:hypothetical protein